MDTNVLLSIKNVSLGYNGTIVTKIKTLDIAQGEVVALVGHSGCGKSTLLAAITGMLTIKEGNIFLDGKERDTAWRSTYLARTLQNFPLYHWLTVKQNLELACRIRKVSNKNNDEILERFSATSFADRYPKYLSGGERCRASLAQAVVSDPKVLLLDEPFTGLDTTVKEEVAESLFDFAKTKRSAILFVTHDLHDACEFSSRVVVLAGRNPSQVVAEIDASRTDAIDAIRSALVEKNHA